MSTSTLIAFGLVVSLMLFVMLRLIFRMETGKPLMETDTKYMIASAILQALSIALMVLSAGLMAMAITSK